MGDVIKREDAYKWSVSKIAEAFRMDRRTVTKRLQEKGVAPSGSRRGNPVYDVADAAEALYSESHKIAGGMDLDQFPDARKAWYQSENERLKFEEKIRRLIPDDEFARELSFLAKTVAAGLDSLPDMLERDAGLAPEAIQRVQATIDALREQMYQAAIVDAEDDDDG